MTKQQIRVQKALDRASTMLEDIGSRLDDRRKKALKELDGRLATLQSRLKKERQVIGRTVDEAVQKALVALNIPGRREIAQLTRKVAELSRKIDSVQRDGRRRVSSRIKARRRRS